MVADLNSHRVIVGKNFLKDTAFMKAKRFNYTECADLKCLTNFELQKGVYFFDDEVEIMNLNEFFKSKINKEDIAASTLGAGVNLDDAYPAIYDALSYGIPLMLISNMGCFVNLISFEVEDTSVVLESVCEKKGTCEIKEQFCKSLETDTTLRTRAADLALLISAARKKDKGIIPFLKYSTFVDYLIWKSNFKNPCENYINRAIDAGTPGSK